MNMGPETQGLVRAAAASSGAELQGSFKPFRAGDGGSLAELVASWSIGC
jgi:hypothetical protein